MTSIYFSLKPYIMEISVPIPVIQKIVSDVSNVPLDKMLSPTGVMNAKKGEVAMSRQVSMALAKKYTNHSLSIIGNMHGGRDHATVLHAVKAVNNAIDTNHALFIETFNISNQRIRTWLKNAQKGYIKREPNGDQIPIKLKLQILKSMILNEVDLDRRQQIFKEVYTEKDKRFKYDRYSATALSGRM